MNHNRHKNSAAEAIDRQKPRIRRLKLFAILIGLIVVIAVAAGVLQQRGVRQARADSIKLIGNWIRPDGGYVISISDINSDGKVKANYSNPNPINVAQAKVIFKGNTVKLFIELRDTGYPGCTYDLSYDKQADRLKGIYYQAEIKQNFDVVFLRR
jgi:uncharacterized protein (DUF2147 family)